MFYPIVLHHIADLEKIFMKLSKSPFVSYNCRIKNQNCIELFNLNQPRLIPEVVETFIRLVEKFDHKIVFVDFSKVEKISNAVVTQLSGLLEYFKSFYSIDVKLENLPELLRDNRFENPEIWKESYNYSLYFNTIFKFNTPREIYKITEGIIANVRRVFICEEGVLESCEWALNEIMDNVLQHSKSTFGYILSSFDSLTNNLSIDIFDLGQGIYRSLKNGNLKFDSASEAVKLALQEGVTRSKDIGQGNGLWGLYKIVNNNEGSLSITSGFGGIRIKTGGELTEIVVPVIPSYEIQTTNVFFNIDLNKKVKMSEIFPGVARINIGLENMEDDDGVINFIIIDRTDSTAARKSGESARKELINIFYDSQRKIKIDFKSIDIISSSFADELIAKTLVHFGLVNFNRFFSIINSNDAIDLIIHRAVSLRLFQELK